MISSLSNTDHNVKMLVNGSIKYGVNEILVKVSGKASTSGLC